MNGRVTTGRPAGAQGHAAGVVSTADENLAGRAGPLHLGMTAETQIGIRHREQLGVDGSMRIVAGRAAFA